MVGKKEEQTGEGQMEGAKWEQMGEGIEAQAIRGMKLGQLYRHERDAYGPFPSIAHTQTAYPMCMYRGYKMLTNLR